MLQALQCFIDQLSESLGQPATSKQMTASPCMESNNNISDYFMPLERNFGHRPRFKLEMMHIFIQQMPVAICKMRSALLEKDYDSLYFEAHRIKSTIKIIGLPQLEIIINKIETNVYLKQDMATLPELFQRFQSQTLLDLNHIQKECKKIMATV